MSWPTFPAAGADPVVLPVRPDEADRVVKDPPKLPPVIAELTIAVVAIWVVFVVAPAVGAAGVPVNVGDAMGAAPRFVNADAALVAPVPPCPMDSAVDRPDSDVILAFAPDVATAELQPKPEPFVHCKACAAPLQPVTVIAVGLALDPVAFPMTVLAACAASAVAETFPNVGGVVGPVDTIACPLVDPAGFSNVIGLSVAPSETSAYSASEMERMSFFMIVPYWEPPPLVLPVPLSEMFVVLE